MGAKVFLQKTQLKCCATSVNMIFIKQNKNKTKTLVI